MTVHKLTTALDLVGLLLLVAAVVVFIWPWTIAGAWAAGGLGALLVSWIIDRRQGARR